MRILLVLLFLPLFSLSQEPAHEIIEDEQLEGLTVYSMLQDERANIWISTSGGLFQYNGYQFQPFTSSKLISSGLFGLVQDHNQNIYCYNTSGQVFQVKNDSLQLFYTLHDSLYHNFFYIEFDNKNNLIISGNGLYSIDQKQSVTLLLNHASMNATPIARKKDQTLEVYSSNGNDLYSLYNNGLIKENTNINFGDKHFYYPIYSDDQEYLGHGRSSQIYKRIGNNFERVEHSIDLPTGCWIFVDKKDDIWVLRNQRGLYFLSKNERTSSYHNSLLFSSYTISCRLEDRDGNIWLGTFGKGLIKISNKENQIINNTSLTQNDELRSITKDDKNNLYVSSINGKLYQYLDGHLEVGDSVPGRIDNVEFNPATNDLFFKHFAYKKGKGVYKQTPFGSVKDISTTASGLTVLSTYTGIHIQGAKKHSEDLKRIGFADEGEFGYHFKTGRLLCATYDEATKILWVGESSSLKQLSKDGEKAFKLHGKSVIALDMEWINQQLYIATLHHGLIVIEKGQVVDHITDKNGLLTNSIKQLKRYKNKLYLGSKQGLQELTLTTGKFRNFQDANGRTLKVLDFEIVDNKALVIHQRGLQMIYLNEELKHVKAPILDFTSILVNGKKANMVGEPTLRYDQNSIEFTFAAKTYNNREQLVYKYKLLGSDQEWKTLPHSDNKLSLTGLQHGVYTLKLYALDASGQRSNEIHYKFRVEQPLWMAWWFYLGITILIIGLVVLFYKRRLKVQRKKARQINELNASKLTAIQSQMNPHFIFNSLNSIQDLVIQGDTENSYTLITKFANLIRKTLNYSDKDFIEFEQEVQLLELYLSLEKLRFKDDFDFEIDTNSISDILIPPMLIQPFIENALIHGLLHKEGHKQLNISFSLKEQLICTITDNGIGREKAKAIKERQKSNHESFAVQAIKKRLEILEGKFEGDIGIRYEDLIRDNSVEGTKVIIRIPIKRLF